MRNNQTLPRREALNNLVLQAIDASGWSAILITDTQSRPFRISMVDATGIQACRVAIYIWNLTHGGRTRDADEYRIQVHVPQFETFDGFQTLILGWYGQDGVFGAFDYMKHAGQLGFSPSFQTSLAALQSASINGLSAHDKGNGEITISFRPDFFMTYVQNARSLHDFGTTGQSLTGLNAALDPQVPMTNVSYGMIATERQVIAKTINERVRSAGFKNRVLRAYDYRCAFCSMQLNLVDAAHILPVASDGSTDETSNGIALCSLHHRAYDAGLVTFNENYRVQVSARRKSYLSSINRDGEIGRFERDLRTVISVPPTLIDRPSVSLIMESNRLRGWQ